MLSHGQDTIHVEKGCAEMCDFHMIAIMFLTGHVIKAKTHLLHHQDLESTWTAASCFQGPDDAPCWEMCDFRMGMGSCYDTA